MTKELLLKTAEQMPEQFHMDELFERLHFLQCIEDAQKSLDEGKGVSHEDATRQIYEHINQRKNAPNSLDT